MKYDTASQFSLTTIVLHWLIALVMIGMLAVGFYMDIFHAYSLYPIHKSIGVIILLFILIRVVWRLKNGWPQAAGSYTNFEILLSKIVHHLLLIGTLLMPMSGILMSGLGGYGVDVFGLELIPKNIDPNNEGTMVPYNATLANIAGGMHGFIAYVLVVSLVLHVAGALKHHVIDKDGTLRRMLGAKI